MRINVFLLCLVFIVMLLFSGCEGFFIPYSEGAPTAYDGVLDWTKEVDDAAWSNRWDHAAVVFDDKLWVMGGYDPTQRGDKDSYMEDVWSSTDGKTWTLVTADAPWKGRRGHAVVVLDGKMFIFGGFVVDEETNIRRNRNDVWSSTDGETWTEVTSSAGWGVRMNHAAVSDGTAIYLIGGANKGVNFYDDVWKTTDGITWNRITNGAVYGKRGGLAATLGSDSNIYIQGGTYPNTVPADDGRKDPVVGVTWENLWQYNIGGTSWNMMAKPDYSRSYRNEHQIVAFDGKIWLLPGVSNTSNRFSNSTTKYSTEVYDYSSWTRDSEGSGFGPRYGYQALVFDPDGNGDRMWVLGGISDNGSQNDVWSAVVGD